MNLVPPTVNSLKPVTATEDSLEVKWEYYDFEHWGGDEVGYIIAYKKVIDYEDFSYDLNDGSYTPHVFQANSPAETEVTAMSGGGSLSYTITDLEPFTLYSVLVATTNEIGTGSAFELRNRTGEGGNSS